MTTPDPLDELGRALFEAARLQRPTEQVRERVVAELSKARARRPSRVGVLALAALAAVVVLAVVVVRSGRREPLIAISAERALPGNRDAPSARGPRIVEEPPAITPPALPSASPARIRNAVVPARKEEETRAAPVAAPASLTDEIASLDRARTALSASDPGAALRALDDYDHVLHGTRLTAEATLLRIDALARSGNASAASELANRFVEANPGSALADRARAFIHAAPAGAGASLRVDGGK